MRTRDAAAECEHGLARLHKALVLETDPQERANIREQIKRTENELKDRRRSQGSRP